MTKTDIICASTNKMIGAATFQNNLMKQINDFEYNEYALEDLIGFIAEASERTTIEINCRESELLKKLAEPEIIKELGTWSGATTEGKPKL